MFRKAVLQDIDTIANIYDKIHELESSGKVSIGWIKGVYPVKDTAIQALKRNDLFVCELEEKVVATAIINHVQVPDYRTGKWEIKADDKQIMVLHTLVVSPDYAKRGIGRKFVEYYEDYARENGCISLRMDTNEKNVNARKLYKKLGFKEIGIVKCDFNGIPDINLVLLEKPLN